MRDVSGERSPLVQTLQADSCKVDKQIGRQEKQCGFGFLTPSVSSSSVLILSRMVHFYIKSSCRIS